MSVSSEANCRFQVAHRRPEAPADSQGFDYDYAVIKPAETP